MVHFLLKLRITFERKQVYYGIGISCNQSDWEKINKTNARSGYRDIKLKLLEIEQRAKSVFDYFENRGEHFSFNKFNDLFFSDKTATQSVYKAFSDKIQLQEKEGKISNANSYSCALHSMKSFFKEKEIRFSDITPDILREYQNWMVINANQELSIAGKKATANLLKT